MEHYLTAETISELRRRFIEKWEQCDAPIHDSAEGLADDAIAVLVSVVGFVHDEQAPSVSG
jgi:hypothetical protein